MVTFMYMWPLKMFQNYRHFDVSSSIQFSRFLTHHDEDISIGVQCTGQADPLFLPSAQIQALNKVGGIVKQIYIIKVKVHGVRSDIYTILNRPLHFLV